MRVLKHEVLFDRLDDFNRHVVTKAQSDIIEAIEAVKWPLDSVDFALNPKKKGNGVKPIKLLFQSKLESLDWILEHRMSLGEGISPGPIDAVYDSEHGLIAVEWETGNISSSHRSLNRMALGILTGVIQAGFLVLPTREMYQYLTDRIGNFREIKPYFPIWKSLDTRQTDNQGLPSGAGRGYLAVIAIEHDRLDDSVECLKKATDGRALK